MLNSFSLEYSDLPDLGLAHLSNEYSDPYFTETLYDSTQSEEEQQQTASESEKPVQKRPPQPLESVLISFDNRLYVPMNYVLDNEENIKSLISCYSARNESPAR